MSAEPQRVLVAEEIAEAGVAMLRRSFRVDLGTGWTPEELASRIGDYDAILIRSATKLDAELIERGARLKVIGRAGIGVDNVDVAAATRRGIIVANAPQSNIVAAAEHTIALMLALARNIPQAHASLTQGRWERSRFGGVEVYEKTLGVLGFGRIGQLVAARARGFGMHVLAFDPFVSAERFRELGAEQAASAADLYERADFITVHLPRTPETRGWLNAEAFAQMKPGVRVINCARGELVDDAALQAAIDSGRVAGAALDVFQTEPITEHPLFGYPNVVVTPHLGASTTEAQDRAGIQTAEQVVAALTGGVVSTAVNIPAVSPEDMEVVGPFLPLCARLGRLGRGLGEGPGIDGVEIEYIGRIAERDTRLLTIAVLDGLLAGSTEEEVNLVNAPALARERGIEVSETRKAQSRDYQDVIRVTVTGAGETVSVSGTTLGPRHQPHLVAAWGQRLDLQLDQDHVALFRYVDVPGMIGRVGSEFGGAGVNIVSATVSRHESDRDGSREATAVMGLTTDRPVPAAVIDTIVASDGFLTGRSVSFAPV
ncbi:MAG: D-3-phosphoglycerate dehydrogenase [uncultured Solirubrobacteraceae bacterium]|uniref:D-3-phosphoglycerate dehydrogenase n=1 Tax=uncultured Solirubrobacteraceae bacterium TaxID=1162706 RepID=A0A6J4SW23_9ACTN|nr:MAG: D-3-phosphoglycerate dehydrogenase [uncultured Solirubrobacteraceae bacterium]